jgi:hypothetical protein
MAITTFVNTIEVKNVSPQLVIFRIQPMTGSTIFDSQGGNIRLQPATLVEAEESRFDLKQLELLENNKLIKRTRYNRRITRDSSGSGTGSGTGST